MKEINGKIYTHITDEKNPRYLRKSDRIMKKYDEWFVLQHDGTQDCIYTDAGRLRSFYFNIIPTPEPDKYFEFDGWANMYRNSMSFYDNKNVAEASSCGGLINTVRVKIRVKDKRK